MTSPPAEGVIHFVAHHQREALPELPDALCAQLLAWRRLVFDLGLIGQDPARYEGAGYGNLSVRLPGGGFLVTGSQTGGTRALTAQGLVVVDRVEVARNAVWSRGPVLPSSESMTHAAVYALDPGLTAVLHVHSPEIFGCAAALGLPLTSAEVAYGTPAMAAEVERLWRDGSLQKVGALVMPGHLDGVVSVGRDLEEACGRMVTLLARAVGLQA